MTGIINHYRKYQVYFFLYLAVVCELLIIIVERDDAEASLLMEQRNLEIRNRNIILELLKNLPTVATAGISEMGVGEMRWHTIGVKGLGDHDIVTTPPHVLVTHDGVIIDTLSYPEEIQDSVVSRESGTPLNTNLHLYKFPWRAPSSAGNYALIVQAGTDRIAQFASAVKAETIKVGSLYFERENIEDAIKSDLRLRGKSVDEFIKASENLRSDTLFVAVLADELDPLQLQADPIVTAVGYPTFNEVKVRGTTPEKVATMNSSIGSMIAPDHSANPWRDGAAVQGKWAWFNMFAEAGKRLITIEAHDRRQAGAKSVSRPATFAVDVRMPVPRKAKPVGAFAGEKFTMDLGVDGLEDIGGYEWTAKIGDTEIASGTFATVAIPLPADAIGESLSITATYRGKPYLVADGDRLFPSSWVYTVIPPIARIWSASFVNGGEYPINNVFSFVAARCGRCASENIANIDPKDIRVTVEDGNGRDLLDEVTVIPSMNPNTGGQLGSTVKFFLKGNVAREGTDAVITVRYGTLSQRYNVALFPN